jgi:calcium/calmodulin-dependent protein kinase kinase 2
MKAARKFKGLLQRKRPFLLDSILGGEESRFVQPPAHIDPLEERHLGQQPTMRHLDKAHSVETDDRRPIEQALVREGVHRDMDFDLMDKQPRDREDAAMLDSLKKRRIEGPVEALEPHHRGHGRDLDAQPQHHRGDGDHEQPREVGKGQAHDPLEELILVSVGLGSNDEPRDPPVVSESPHAVEGNVYEKAYQEEVERIRAEKGHQTTLFLTRRVSKAQESPNDKRMLGSHDDDPPANTGGMDRVPAAYLGNEAQSLKTTTGDTGAGSEKTHRAESGSKASG